MTALLRLRKVANRHITGSIHWKNELTTKKVINLLMMTLDANKQKLHYSLQNGQMPIYATDENGNIIYYTDSDGNKIPLETGEYITGYLKPVSFFANINNKLNEVVWQDYGIDDSTNYAQIVASKDELPLKAGSVI